MKMGRNKDTGRVTKGGVCNLRIRYGKREKGKEGRREVGRLEC